MNPTLLSEASDGELLLLATMLNHCRTQYRPKLNPWPPRQIVHTLRRIADVFEGTTLAQAAAWMFTPNLDVMPGGPEQIVQTIDLCTTHRATADQLQAALRSEYEDEPPHCMINFEFRDEPGCAMVACNCGWLATSPPPDFDTQIANHLAEVDHGPASKSDPVFFDDSTSADTSAVRGSLSPAAVERWHPQGERS